MSGFNFKKQLIAASIALVTAPLFAVAGDGSTLEKVSFEKTSKGSVVIKMDFDKIPDLESYLNKSKKSISLDFGKTVAGRGIKDKKVNLGYVKELDFDFSKDNAKLDIFLSKLRQHTIERQGNSLLVHVTSKGLSTLNGDKKGSYRFNPDQLTKVEDINFRLGEGSKAGQLIIDLNDKDVNINVHGTDKRIVIDLSNVNVTEAWSHRLDVRDFGTTAQFVDIFQNGDDGRVVIEIDEESDYSALQMDDTIVVEMRPKSEIEKDRRKGKQFNERKLNFNFEDADLRSVLFTFAEFTKMNIVISDSVEGSITLNLKKVPADQILDLILKSKGLDKRVEGNILLIAPAVELAEREKIELENRRQLKALATLHTEFIKINYADATDVAFLFTGTGTEGSVAVSLTEGSSVRIDKRTNTIILTETRSKINEFKDILKEIDIPVQQVMVEARIVISTTDVAEEIGVRWGVSALKDNNNGTKWGVSGNLTGVNNALQNPTGTNGFDQSLSLDMGVFQPSSAISLGYLSADALIGLELSAMESEGSVEVISTPKVITSDKHRARIASGTSIPYQEATSSGATSTDFKEAVLSLEVEPQITPDNNIILDLKIQQSTVGKIYNGIPSIDTQEIETKVLVRNGETIVLGGIYTQEQLKALLKTPFLGDIPGIGRFFKKNKDTSKKAELLIFVTPRIIGNIR